MNKAELIEALTGRLGDRRSATAALDAVLAEIQNAVTKGDKVSITGFGVFEKRVRAARTARNPRTGESVKVKKTSVPAFRPGASFKELVAAGRVPKATKAAAPAKKAAPAKATKAVKATTVRKATPAKKATRAATSTTRRDRDGCRQGPGSPGEVRPRQHEAHRHDGRVGVCPLERRERGTSERSRRGQTSGQEPRVTPERSEGQ